MTKLKKLSQFEMKNIFFKIAITLLFIHEISWGNEFAVTNLLDSGPGSLRQALIAAADGDDIVFDTLLSGILLLLSPLPSIGVDINITGPSSDAVSISGNALFPIFDIGANISVYLNHLNIINGFKVGSGAGLYIGDNALVSASEVAFLGCIATGSEGGAIHVGSNGVFEANNISFFNNSSGGLGDDIFLKASSSLEYSCSETISAIELFGTGIAFKSGVGEVTFTIPSSCPLTLVVEEGRLISTGVRTEPTIVFGTLEGEETCLYVANHGTFKPSETVGASTTTADYHQSRSATLEIALTPLSNDFLHVDGNAYLQGTLSILPEEGTYIVGNNYTILTTDGVVNSTFDSIISSSMTFNVLYFNDRVDIQITSL